MYTFPGKWVPKGFEKVSTLTSAVGLADIPSDAEFALLQAVTKDVSYRDDGEDAAAAVGMLLKAGEPPTLYPGNLSQLSFFEAESAATLNVLYYGTR